MGNTTPGGYIDEVDRSTDPSLTYPQKNVPEDPTKNNQHRHHHDSLRSTQKSSSFTTISGGGGGGSGRMVRHVTHTTNATYDDAASLSTCATNTNTFICKTLSNDAHSLDDQIQQKLHISNTPYHHQQQKELLQKQSKQTKSTLSSRTKPQSLFGNDEKQVVGVMYTSSTSPVNHQVSTNKSNLQLQRPPLNNPKNNSKLQPVTKTTTSTSAQDQWQSAWEEDDESSDDDDEDDKRNSKIKNKTIRKRSNDESIEKPKPTSRRIKSDTILSKKVQDAIMQDGGNGFIGGGMDGDYERPNIMMFFPLLRVLGKGSFGKVCKHLICIYLCFRPISVPSHLILVFIVFHYLKIGRPCTKTNW